MKALRQFMSVTIIYLAVMSVYMSSQNVETQNEKFELNLNLISKVK